jgi:hypothetical protein
MIDIYLESQDARPFMEAADRYLDLLWRLYQILEEEAADPEKQNAIVGVFQRFAGGQRNGDIGFADVDAIVAAFCEKMSIEVPQSTDDKMSIHIEAVEAWANTITRRENDETKKAKRVPAKGSRKKLHKTGH